MTQSELLKIFNELKVLLQKYEPPFTPKADIEGKYDLWSHKELVVNGKKRDEIYFAGLILQSSYVGFYFMPVYAEPEVKRLFTPELLKLLKGKSCFHVKKLDPILIKSIEQSLKQGFDLYRQRNWV